MEDGSITDSQITASSFHKAPAERPPDNCKPKNGRLNQKGNEGVVGGWCPAYSDLQTPWFQVDLRTTNQVEGVIIQGSTDPLNSYKDWVTHYKVSYSDDQRTWHYAGGSSLQTAKVSCRRLYNNNTYIDLIIIIITIIVIIKPKSYSARIYQTR